MKYNRLYLFLTILYSALHLLDPNALFSLDLVSVEGGSFVMGHSNPNMLGKGETKDETPPHTVNITNNFSISKTEITLKDAVKVYNYGIKNNIISVTDGLLLLAKGDTQLLLPVDNIQEIKITNEKLVLEKGKEDIPVYGVTWYGAVVFCNLLSRMENRLECYSLSNWQLKAVTGGYRLPTEAEWAFACRGGIKSRGYRYSGANTPGVVSWYIVNSLGVPRKVARKRANELGLYDMSGNMWEWCNDYYSKKYYVTSPVDNPKGPESGFLRVVRGGSGYSYKQGLRITHRYSYLPAAHHSTLGFRVVLQNK